MKSLGTLIQSLFSSSGVTFSAISNRINELSDSAPNQGASRLAVTSYLAKYLTVSDDSGDTGSATLDSILSMLDPSASNEEADAALSAILTHVSWSTSSDGAYDYVSFTPLSYAGYPVTYEIRRTPSGTVGPWVFEIYDNEGLALATDAALSYGQAQITQLRNGFDREYTVAIADGKHVAGSLLETAADDFSTTASCLKQLLYTAQADGSIATSKIRAILDSYGETPTLQSIRDSIASYDNLSSISVLKLVAEALQRGKGEYTSGESHFSPINGLGYTADVISTVLSLLVTTVVVVLTALFKIVGAILSVLFSIINAIIQFVVPRLDATTGRVSKYSDIPTWNFALASKSMAINSWIWNNQNYEGIERCGGETGLAWMPIGPRIGSSAETKAKLLNAGFLFIKDPNPSYSTSYLCQLLLTGYQIVPNSLHWGLAKYRQDAATGQRIYIQGFTGGELYTQGPMAVDSDGLDYLSYSDNELMICASLSLLALFANFFAADFSLLDTYPEIAFYPDGMWEAPSKIWSRIATENGDSWRNLTMGQKLHVFYAALLLTTVQGIDENHRVPSSWDWASDLIGMSDIWQYVFSSSLGDFDINFPSHYALPGAPAYDSSLIWPSISKRSLLTALGIVAITAGVTTITVLSTRAARKKRAVARLTQREQEMAEAQEAFLSDPSSYNAKQLAKANRKLSKAWKKAGKAGLSSYNGFDTGAPTASTPEEAASLAAAVSDLTSPADQSMLASLINLIQG